MEIDRARVTLLNCAAEHEATLRIAAYTRISNDAEGRGLGVERQRVDVLALCRRIAAGRPAVVVWFRDNDKSASRHARKPRPEYDEMYARVMLGEFECIAAYTTSRLSRAVGESSKLANLAETTGVRLEFVASPVFDLNTGQGRMTYLMLATIDEGQADATRDLVRRKHEQNAASGKRHGKMPYGWRDEDGRQVLDDAEAEVIRELAQRIIAGESTYAIVRDFAARGVTYRGGKPFTRERIRPTLLRHANAGLLQFRSSVAGQGDWPPLYDVETHDRVRAVLDSPTRRTSVTNGTARHLLTGIALCGLAGCGGTMGVALRRNHPNAPGPAYVCQSCNRVIRSRDKVDALVIENVIATLAGPDAPNLLGGNAETMAACEAEIVALAAEIDSATDQMIARTITAEQLGKISAARRSEIADARKRLAAARPFGEVAAFLGVDARALWDNEPRLDVKRAVVARLLRVTILPNAVKGSPRFDPDSVRVELRQ